MPVIKKQSIDQPNAGWGFICSECEHRRRDEKEHDFFPCKKVEFRGQFYHPKFKDADGTWIDGIMPSLIRWEDGSETCGDLEEDAR